MRIVWSSFKCDTSPSNTFLQATFGTLDQSFIEDAFERLNFQVTLLCARSACGSGDFRILAINVYALSLMIKGNKAME